MHGWIVHDIQLLACIREMADLEVNATFEILECTFPFMRCIRQGRLEAESGFSWRCRYCGLWKKIGRRGRWVILIETSQGRWEGPSNLQLYVGRQLLSQSKENLEHMLKELVEEVSKWDLEPKPASLWWTSTCANEEPEDMMIETEARVHLLSFADKFKILGYMFNCGNPQLWESSHHIPSCNSQVITTHFHIH